MQPTIPRQPTKEEVMREVRRWRRERGMPPLSPTRVVFNKSFNSVGEKLKAQVRV